MADRTREHPPTVQPLIATRVYVLVYLALLVFLVLTVAASFLEVGPLNLLLALTIAVVKAVLVILFFMHVRYSSRLTWVFVGAGFFWLFILLGGTLADSFLRYFLPGS